MNKEFPRPDPGASERTEIKESYDTILKSLENFQDFLLYAAEKRLTQREMDMFCQRFGLLEGKGRTLQEVGNIYGLTRERIRQLLNRSLRKIVGTGTRQLNRKQWKEPCAMAVAYARDEICHGKAGDLDRFIDFADKELPHLKLPEATNLLGYFFGGKKGIKEYRERVSQRLKETKQQRRSEYRKSKLAKAMDEVMAQVIWPGSKVAVDRGRLIAFKPQRAISEDSRGKTGAFYSKKMQRNVHYESELERKFLELLDAHEDVTFFQEQPLKIPYQQNGISHTYFPDIIFVLKDGCGVVVEIKPRQEMAVRKNWTKWAAMRAYCRNNGYGYLITEGRRSIQQVRDHEIRPQVRQQVLDALDDGPLNWSQYTGLRDQCAIKWSELLALIIQERLSWQPRPFRLEKVTKS